MSITHDIGYVMAAMEDAGCSSTKLIHSGSRKPSKSSAQKSSDSKTTQDKDTPGAKGTEAEDESVRYSTDSESIIKDKSPSSPPKKSLRSSLLKKIGRHS